jgi:hypothetical protein
MDQYWQQCQQQKGMQATAVAQAAAVMSATSNSKDNNNNNLFSIRYSNTLSYTNHKVLL